MTTRPRVHWTAAQVATLDALYRAGLVHVRIAETMGMSEVSVKDGLHRFKITTGPAATERYTNMVRERWGMHPGKIAQVCRISRKLVDEIAERLGLVYVPAVVPVRKKTSARQRLQWAFDNRRTDREAGLIWDMARGSLGLPPTGAWY